MLDTMQKLHDFANRYPLRGRLGEQEGDVKMFGSEGVKLTWRGAVRWEGAILTNAIFDTERNNGLYLWQDGEFVPLAEFDETFATLVERFEGLHDFERALDNFNRDGRSLREAWERLTDADREALTLPTWSDAGAALTVAEAHLKALRPR